MEAGTEEPVEELPVEESSNRSDLELQAMSTTVWNLPCDCVEMMMERLSLTDAYNGWISLRRPNSRESRFDKPSWFVAEFETYCSLQTPDAFDIRDDGRPSDCADGIINQARFLGTVSSHICGQSCSLQMCDPVLEKEGQLHLKFQGGNVVQSRGSDEGPYPFYTGGRKWFAKDKGLFLFLIYDEEYNHGFSNVYHRFVVLNPTNMSMAVLPSVPNRFCRHSNLCDCQVYPLKLVVEKEEKGGRQTTPSSSSYKAYVLQCSMKVYLQKRAKPCRILVYDSKTKLWAHAGAEWAAISAFTRIFPRSDALYVSISTGRFTGGYLGQFCFGCHDVIYKFRNREIVGRAEAPCRLKREDRFCDNYRNHVNNYEENVHPCCSCGCISSTVYEAEGKMFYFQQTSWVGEYGPNCISAQLWELGESDTIYRKLPAGPMGLLQSCATKYCSPFDLANVMFAYRGILFVVRHGWLKNNSGGEYHYIAGWHMAKKRWCKIPETILTNIRLDPGTFVERNLADVDSFEFHPHEHTRA